MRTPVFALIVAVSTAVTAQELPNPKPGKAHQVLAKDAGTWDCSVKMFFQGPDGPPTEYRGVEVNKMVSGDLYVQTTFTCKMGDRDFEGHCLMGYHPPSKKYVGTWVDNFTSAPCQLEGEYNAEANTFTVHRRLLGEDGTELQQEQVTTWIDDSQKKFEMFLLIPDSDGNQFKVKVMEMTAKKRE